MKSINKSILKIRKHLKEKKYTDFIKDVSVLLCEVMTENYYKFLKEVSPADRYKIESIKKQTAKNIEDKKIGLGRWTGIYTKSGFFNRVSAKYFSPFIFNEITEERNDCIHSNYKLKDEKAFKIYVYTVNILKELGYHTDPKVHKLCEICLEKWSKRNGLCYSCEMKVRSLIELVKEKERQANEFIFKIRCQFNKELEDAWKKYLPPYIKIDESEIDWSEVLIPSPETKEDYKRRKKLEKERKMFKRDLEKWRNKLIEKVYQEKEQKKILKFIIEEIKKDYSKDYWYDWFLQDLILRWKENGIIDLKEKMRLFNTKKYVKNSLEDILHSMILEEIKKDNTLKKMKNVKQILEYGVLLDCALYFLENLWRYVNMYFELQNVWNELEESLESFPYLNKNGLNKILKMFEYKA